MSLVCDLTMVVNFAVNDSEFGLDVEDYLVGEFF